MATTTLNLEGRMYSHETSVLPGTPSSIKSLGKDEHWLQDWLAADPGRLGLGEVRIVTQELHQTKGGSLDILAASEDRFYSIEVQLGEVDESHGFRVIDYWARNRISYPGKEHVAVLLAESTTGRYRPALEALVEHLPLIVIELDAWKGDTEAVLVPRIVLAPKGLDIATLPADLQAERTVDDWKETMTEDAWALHEAFVAWAHTLGDVKVDYRPASYVGIRRGRRVWAPLWPRSDGLSINLPDPDGQKGDEPSPAFEHFDAILAQEGISLSWTKNYNAGANPIGIRLRKADFGRPAVREFLRATFEILDPKVGAWSDTHQLDGVADSDDASAAVQPDPPELSDSTVAYEP